jgi:hypothetical protein
MQIAKANDTTSHHRRLEAFKSTRIENSNYADFTLDALPRGPVTIAY